MNLLKIFPLVAKKVFFTKAQVFYLGVIIGIILVAVCVIGLIIFLLYILLVTKQFYVSICSSDVHSRMMKNNQTILQYLYRLVMQEVLIAMFFGLFKH